MTKTQPLHIDQKEAEQLKFVLENMPLQGTVYTLPEPLYRTIALLQKLGALKFDDADDTIRDREE